MLIPYRFDITFTRAPIANAILIGVTCVIYVAVSLGIIPIDVVDAMMLKDWSLSGIFGCLFLHGNIVHLLGNMLFLWVFGNAVCSTVGNVWYIPLYLLLGCVSSATYLLLGSGPALGASGAINGIVGISLIFFPASILNVGYFFFFFWGTFQIKSYWMILFWLAFDVVGILLGGGHVGYWAHIGGFMGGVFTALFLLTTKAVFTFDATLFDLFTGNGPETLRHHQKTYSRFEEGGKVLPGQRTLSRKPAQHAYAMNGHKGKVDPEAERIHGLMTGGTYKPSPSAGRIPGPPLNLRVLRVTAEMNQTTCYFINDGEELRDLAVRSVNHIIVAVHPPKGIRRGEPGWFRFVTPVGRIPANPVFILEYTTTSGKHHKRAMALSEGDRRILSGAEA